MSETNEAIAITSDEEEDTNSGKPIIKLFKRLIANDSKQNTILTNNQILDLLSLEFDVDIAKLHSLEVDIYISLMKKFLKDWPKWEEFDSEVNELKCNYDMSEIGKMLQEKHVDLKQYLQNALDIAKPLAKDAVSKAKAQGRSSQVTNKLDKDAKVNDHSIVLEIDASRSQLNNLIIRRPFNGTIFNRKNYQNEKPIGALLKTSGAMNYWNISLELKVKLKNNLSTLYKREIVNELKHTIVNKNLESNTSPFMELDQELQVKKCGKSTEIDSSKLVEYIDGIITKNKYKEFHEILVFIKKDLLLLPRKVLNYASYKRYLNRYSYVRNLCAEVESTRKNSKLDLHLEEVLLPVMKMYIAGFDVPDPETDICCVFVECTICGFNYSGPSVLMQLKMHLQFHDLHEPPFNCTNCNKELSVITLTENWWCHKCESD